MYKRKRKRFTVEFTLYINNKYFVNISQTNISNLSNKKR